MAEVQTLRTVGVPRRRKLGVIVPGTDANLRLEVCSGLLAAGRDNGGVLEG